MRTNILFILVAVAVTGCDRNPPSPPKPTVTVYTSIDEEVARPIIDDFKARTGIEVVLRTDFEANKTLGLVDLLRAEKANPQADVFWNNEVFHTINLADEGVLVAYESPVAGDVPGQFKDAKHRWAASGMRLRVIARAPSANQVNQLEDLLDPKLKGKICMGKPALGTIAGHLAAWFVQWGPEKAEKFLRDLKANEIALVGGNADVVKAIGTGTMLAGITDNDDVDSMLRQGKPISGVPARTADGGTLAMPLTVAMVTGAKNPEPAKKVIDYLLSREVEKKLIEAKYAARSVREGASGESPVMKIDYTAAAKMLPRAVTTARKILEGRE